MRSLLQQLRQHSTIVADTGDLDVIKRFQPEDATTNPSLILKAVRSGSYDPTIERIVSESVEVGHSPVGLIEDLCDRLVVAMGTQILQQIPGRVSTEVNARLSFNRDASLAKGRRLVQLYEAAGVGRERVLIKLAATWEGICAAEILEREGIQCNLTLIFSLAQARACAEAGVYLVSPFVGRILDWHLKADPARQYTPDEEPGVIGVRQIRAYFRQQGYRTQVMGASFRNLGEVLALAGCDRLTISPGLLETLATSEGSLAPVPLPEPEPSPDESRLTEDEFRWQLNENAMAGEKLAEGIRGFEADQRQLEELLGGRIRAVQGS